MFLLRVIGTSPPCEGGAGGVKRHSQYAGPMRQFRGVQPSRNRAPGCGYAGIPPLPPLLKGGTTRNGIRMKARLVQDELIITPGMPWLSVVHGSGRLVEVS